MGIKKNTQCPFCLPIGSEVDIRALRLETCPKCLDMGYPKTNPPKPQITPEEYLNAKFGKQYHCKYDCYLNTEQPTHTDRPKGELAEVLEEFLALNNALDLQQLRNPRSKRWVVVDRAKAQIICDFANELETE